MGSAEARGHGRGGQGARGRGPDAPLPLARAPCGGRGVKYEHSLGPPTGRGGEGRTSRGVSCLPPRGFTCV